MIGADSEGRFNREKCFHKATLCAILEPENRRQVNEMLDKAIFENGCSIIIPTGVHYVPEPIVLRGENIRIVGEDGTVLRAAVKMRREDFWEEEPGVWCAKVPRAADGFYIGDRKYKMARYPKAKCRDEVFEGYAADCVFPSKTQEWADPTGGYIHAMHAHLWGGYSYRIEGKNADGTLILSGGWQNNRQMGMHDEYRYAENIREELTEEGEWYFDERNMQVYVKLYPEDDLDQAEVAVGESFFVLEDCKNVSIENVSFERSCRTFMKTKEPLLRSDWTIYRGGAILVKNSVNCTIDRCVFRNIGSNGVFVDGNNENIRITRSHFLEIGASGLCFVGRPDSVRSPLFEYNERQSIKDIDTEKGPKSNNYPKKCTVEDCLVEKIGLVEKQAAGIEISMSHGITVKNCTICHTSRAGINISEGTFGGHRIEGCDVFDTVRETGDHGSFNSWGRDRYWMLEGAGNDELREYALLDMLEPNVITRSRFRCDKGWDIDLDDGSSNYMITENLCLNGGIKLREGFYRRVRNNIMVNNTLHFHVWYENSGDIVENNIVFKEYAPIGMPEKWGERVDQNVLVAPGQSIPALDGFEIFPTEFGVRYEPLRKIADRPTITVETVRSNGLNRKARNWGSMMVKDIETDGEMSVYGTVGHSGALVVTVAAGSDAEKRGLLADDVIVGLGDAVVNSVDDLEGCVFNDNVKVTVIRKQNRIML